jgi:hypothetical protein
MREITMFFEKIGRGKMEINLVSILASAKNYKIPNIRKGTKNDDR